MKNILFMSDCHYYRLALKCLFERKTDHTMEFVSLESLPGRDVSQATVLIHLAENNYSAIVSFIENRKLFLSKNSIVIASKQLISILSRHFDEKLRFIDEMSIFDEQSNIEVLENKIESRGGLSEVNEKIDLLSISEFLVLSMLLAGLSPSNIAFRTKKSIKTISTQKVCALRKLDLDNTPHSMIKLARGFRFPATLGPLIRRRKIVKLVGEFRGAQHFCDSHIENKTTVVSGVITECRAEQTLYCEGKVDIHPTVKISTDGQRCGQQKLAATAEKKLSSFSWIAALLTKVGLLTLARTNS